MNRKERRKQQRAEAKHPHFPEYKEYVRKWLKGDKKEPCLLYKDWRKQYEKE